MMILSLTAGLAACGGSAGEGSQDAAKDVGVQRYAWPLGSSSPEDLSLIHISEPTRPY